MKNLFYSPNQKVLFWIKGYPLHTVVVEFAIKEMQKDIIKFCKVANINSSEVMMIFKVLSSLRYKSMRVYYAKVEKPVKDAFVIGEDWDMFKWIES